MERSASEKLGRLYDLILQEREAAKGLDMVRLAEVVQQKEVVARDLAAGSIDQEDEEVRELADRIRRENRRNAYLFWSGLNFVRETMDFFGRQAPPAVYDAWGGAVQSPGGGRLLSGRI